jgi:WhiB family transcriptional regulator, redox-sensing transcriptional regulator
MTRRNAARRQAATATALAVPGRWAERTLCAQADPDAWLAEKGQRALAAVAVRICGDCPVRAQCLDYALSGGDTWGGIGSVIWGGATPQERDQLRQQRNAVAA